MEIRYDYERVAADLEAQITSGRIPKGGRLPNERELAEMYSVSAGTVRRAIRTLRDKGLVQTLPSKGTFVVG